MALAPVMELTPYLILRAYAAGIFPMAEDADSRTIYWFDPEYRGVLPLDGFHLSRRLRRTVKGGRFQVSVDAAFAETIQACGEATEDRPRTWINDEIERVYTDLHQQGHAHSVEVRLDGELVGGLYGVAIGGAFFGESMFSRVRDASKVALVHLVARLIHGGFALLDTQFVTDHLAQFGAVEIPRALYRRRLANALTLDARFHCGAESSVVSSFLQSTTQMS